MSTYGWTCGFTTKDRQKKYRIRELPGLEHIFVTKRGRWKCFEYAECKDDGDLVKQWMSKMIGRVLDCPPCPVRVFSIILLEN